MLCDESHAMLESYGVSGMKKFMGREYMGISRITYIISEYGMAELLSLSLGSSETTLVKLTTAYCTFVNGGKNVQPLFRYLISYLGNKLIKFLLKSSFNEFTTSYRGFNLKKLNNFNLNQIKGNGYSFFMETVIVLERLKYKSFEFPIHFKDRIYGKSKIPKIEIFRTFKNLISLYFKK